MVFIIHKNISLYNILIRLCGVKESICGYCIMTLLLAKLMNAILNTGSSLAREFFSSILTC